jgi:Tfp pilus assembly protein PilV
VAALKVNIKYRVTASSILEVVVSMVIIVMVLGISLMIYSNVVRQSLSAKQLKAQFLLQQTLLQVEQGASKDIEVVEQWQIVKEVKPFESGTRLAEVHMKVYDENHNLITEIHKVIINHDTE